MHRWAILVGVLVLACLSGSPSMHASMAQTAAGPDVRPAGYVAAWGDNFSGELGTRACCTSRSRPAPVTGLMDAVSVAADWRHALAARSDGSVLEWGRCCGPLAGIHPARVSGLTSVTDVAAGEDFDLARRADGTVWAWGNDGYGQLGPSGRDAPHSGCPNTVTCSLPVQVSGVDHVVQVAATYSAAVALRDDGTVWSWGSPGPSQNPEEGRQMAAVHRIGTLSNIAAITVGNWLAAAVTADGHVWVWQFHWPTTAEPEGWSQPIEIPGLDDARGVAANGRYVAAIRADGSVSSWDTEAPGVVSIQLGQGTPVAGIHNVRSISGRGPFLALEADGSVWAWGSNLSGELGNGTVQDSATPVRVAGLTDATAVTAGNDSSYAIVRAPVADIPPPTPAACLPRFLPGRIPPSLRGLDAANPGAMAIDQSAGRVYVLNAPRPVPQDQPVSCGASVTTLDLKTRAVIRTVLVGPMNGPGPYPFAVAERAHHVFVASPGAEGNDYQGSVSMLDAVSGKVIKTIPIPGGAAGVVLGRATGRVFVLGGSDLAPGRMTVTGLATRDGRIMSTQILDAFDGGAVPTVVDDGTRTVYVSEYNRIYRLDEGSGRKIGEIDSMPCIGSLAIDHRAGRLFTASDGAKEVSGFFCAIDLRTRQSVQTVDEGTFASATVLAVDESAGVVLTVEGGSPFSSASTYLLRRSKDGSALPRPQALKVKRYITLVLVDDRTGRMFLSDRPDSLSVLDPRRWTVVGTIPLHPTGIMAVAGSERLIVSVGPNDVVTTASMDRTRP